MEDVLIKIGVSVVVTAITGLGGWLIAQIRRYKKLSKQEEDKILKASIAETFNE